MTMEQRLLLFLGRLFLVALCNAFLLWIVLSASTISFAYQLGTEERQSSKELTMLHVDATADGREIEITSGQSFELCLPENPTTGFRWVLNSKGEPVCTLVNEQFQSGGQMPGQGGRHCWQFQAVQSGTGTLKLSYQRPWEQASTALQTFTLQIRARS